MRQTCGTEESRGKPRPPEGGECVKDMQFSESCSGYGDPRYLLPRIERRRGFPRILASGQYSVLQGCSAQASWP